MNTQKVYIAILLCLVCFCGFSQNQIKSYIQKNIVPVATIEAESGDFSDLEAIGDAIGDAKIIMMGEQDHGDAPGYFAKVRLIRYLHEKKGFNVVAFENDFFNTNVSWQQVREGKLDIDSFRRYKMAINWSDCGKEAPLFDKYLQSTLKTNNPLEITGFDNVTATPQTLPLLDSVIRNLHIPITLSPEYNTGILPLLNSWYTHVEDTVTMNKIIAFYTIMRKQLLEKKSKEDFWILTVDNLVAHMQQYKGWRKDQWLNYRDRNIRDKQMAINLKWLSEVKYPNQKIIVWAHNYHVSKYAGCYPEAYLNNAKTMGTYLTEDPLLMKQTYIIGFTSYAGTAGRFGEKTYKIQKAKSNGFESWIHKDYNYAFVDFRKFNRANPEYNELFYMKCAMSSPFQRNARAQWNRIFDGVFYIRNTYSCNQ